MITPILSRRDLLKTGGVLVVGFAFDAALPRWTWAQTPAAGGNAGKPLDASEVDSFLAIHRDGTEVRQAAATARQALLALGATRLGRPAGELTIVDGEVRPLAGGAGVGVGTLIGDRRFSLKVDSKAPIREPARYGVVGKPLPRPDVPDKCTGHHVYVHDFTLPGMLHARVIRPAAIGAKLVSVDDSS